MAVQISIFLENKPGKLAKITGILKENQINIRAIKISSSSDFGVVKLLVDKPDICYTALRNANITAYKRDIIGIVLEDKPGGLYEIAAILGENGVNIEDSYGFVIGSKGKAALIIETAQPEELHRILDENNIKYYDENFLYS